MSGRKLMIWVLLGFTGVSVGAPAPQNDDTLLKAINFALTATGGATYSWSDRDNCVVVAHRSPAIDTYYLNRIDESRIMVQPYTTTTDQGVERWLGVELHGEEPVYEMSFEPGKMPGMQVGKWTDYTVHLPELLKPERDRLVRAWKYIYTHGCKSAKSSF